jgi:Lon protease-like protein
MPDQPLSLHDLPLFPLGAVLFPDGALTLRVFELRYLDLLRKCHQTDAPFGVVALAEGQEVLVPGAPPERLQPVGTLAHIIHLEQAQPGVLMALCRGEQRFRIEQSRRLKNGLWVGDVALLPPDAAVIVPPDLQHVAQMLRKTHDALRGRPAASMPGQTRYSDCGWVANRWCELLPLPLPARQRLMALDAPLVRLELVADMLVKRGVA